jgi:hypothetical protein
LKLWSVLIGALVVGSLAVGCGSGGDETIAKQEYVDQATAICEKGLERRDAAVGKILAERTDGGLDSATAEKLYVDVAIPRLAVMADELEELDEPASGADLAANFVSALQGGIEEVETNPKKIFQGSFDPFLEAEKKATAFGLEECTDL